MKPSAQPTISLNSRVRHRKVGDDGVVVCMHSGQVLIVNEVGIHILGQLKQPQTVSALTQSISDVFAVDLEQASNDLSVYLAELAEQDVVTSSVDMGGENV